MRMHDTVRGYLLEARHERRRGLGRGVDMRDVPAIAACVDAIAFSSRAWALGVFLAGMRHDAHLPVHATSTHGARLEHSTARTEHARARRRCIPSFTTGTRTDAPRRPPVMLDDETLRDGLQSPSVRCPTIDEKLRILHLIDRLGIDTADIGLPGAGPHVVARRGTAGPGDCRSAPPVAGQLRRAHAHCRHHGRSPRSRSAPGIPIECCTFIGSSPLRQYAEGWTLDQLLRLTEEAITFAVREGLPVMYVTEDTTRADPDTLRALYSTAIRAGAKRVCIADTVGPCDAGRRGGGRPLHRQVRRRMRRRRRDRLARPPRSRLRRSPTRWRRSRPARRACTAPRSASASASATRRWTLLLVNLVLMGYLERDLSALCEYCEAVSRGDRRADPAELSGRRPRRVPHGDRRPRRRRDQGVPEAAISSWSTRCIRACPRPGRARAGDRDRADVGQIERRLLAGEARPASHREVVDRIFAKAKASASVLTEQEILESLSPSLSC